MKELTKVQSMQELSDKYLECRSYYSHSLSGIGFFYWKSDLGRGICKVSKCSRCGTYREDYLYSDGLKARTQYHYPEGYLLEGIGVVRLREVRKEMLKRVEVVHASPDDLPLPKRVKSKVASRNPKKVSQKSVDTAVR